MSLLDVLQSSAINTNFYISIQRDGRIRNLNLSVLLSERKEAQVTSWEELLAALTDEIVDGYEESIPSVSGDRSKKLLSYSAHMDQDIELHYASAETPEDRDVRFFKKRYTDLIVTSKNPERDPYNFLVSVNGLITYPTKFNGELIVYDGAKHLWGCNHTLTPGVVVVDFSHIGGYEAFKFSECTVKTMGGNFINLSDSDMLVELPVSMEGKTPMLVMANAIYTPDTFQRIDDTHIIIPAPRLETLWSRVIKGQASFDALYGTDIIHVNRDKEQYLRDMAYSSEHIDSFIVLVDTPNMFVEYEDCSEDFFDRTVFSQSTLGGILRSKRTGEIVDFTAVEYSTVNNLYLERKEERYLLEGTGDSVYAISEPHFGAERFAKRMREGNTFYLTYISA